MSKLIVCFAAASALAFSGAAYAQAIIPPAKPHPAKTTKTTTPPPADDAAATAATPPAADTGDVAQATPPATSMPAAPAAPAQPAATTMQTAQATPPAASPMTPAAPMAAQPATPATQPAPMAPATAATPAAPAAPVAAVAAGMQLKDNTGVVVGQIAELKPDATGRQMATVKMGTDSFTVAANALAVQNGAAVINLTQAQLQAQVHKPGA